MNLNPVNNELKKKIFGLLMLLYLISIFYSKFLLTLIMILWAVWMIADISIQKNWKVFYSQFKSAKVFALLLLVFVGVLISGINSENTTRWLSLVKMRLPFLVLPIVFFYFRKEIKNRYFNYLLSFFILCLLSSIPVMIHYFSNIESIHDALGRGQAIETPIDHIKYSLLIAFGVIISFTFCIEQKFKSYRVLILVGGVFLMLFLHILAVRSGLAVLYIGLLFLLLYHSVFDKQRRKYFILSICGLLLVPTLAINTLPSLKQKIGYMKYDINQYLEGKGKDYSDSERIYTYIVGWKLFKASPLLGTGIGDLKDDCKSLSQILFDNPVDKYPHNMFLFTLAGMGILGFLMCFVPIIYPLVFFKDKIEINFLIFNIMIFSSFLVENTIQRSYSTAFYLLFLLAGMCYMWEKEKGHPNGMTL